MIWPADKVERRQVAQLTPYARNARTHSPEQIAPLSQTSSSRMTSDLMGLQPVSLDSQNAMNAVESFLGFTVRNEPEFRRCIADKAVARFKHRVRELTGRHRGINLERMIRELASYLRGWAGYFGFSQWHELQSLDGWIRRRLRCVVWVQWKTRGRRWHELQRLGVPGPAVREAVFSPKGPWRLSFTNAMHRAFTNARFRRGLPPMAKLVNA
jgi:Group II intron, maturase-specific domain